MSVRDVRQVFLTGVDGFVGSALLARLASLSDEGRGYRVRVCTRRRGVRPPAGADSVVVADIGSDIDWREALLGVDVVVHAAARVHVTTDGSAKQWDAFRRVNVDGTLNLARQAAASGVWRFIFISSIKVNGESTDPGKPFTADDSPAPVGPYGMSKYEAERGLRKLATETGMEVVIVRPPLVYGPGVKANFLDMLRWLNKGFPLPLGGVNNKRSLVAVDNLVDLLVVCMHHSAAANRVFLVSDGEDLSIKALLRRTGCALGRPVRLFPVPVRLLQIGAACLGRPGLAQQLCSSLQLDIDQTRELLGWEPLVSVASALDRTVSAFLISHRE